MVLDRPNTLANIFKIALCQRKNAFTRELPPQKWCPFIKHTILLIWRIGQLPPPLNCFRKRPLRVRFILLEVLDETAPSLFVYNIAIIVSMEELVCLSARGNISSQPDGTIFIGRDTATTSRKICSVSNHSLRNASFLRALATFLVLARRPLQGRKLGVARKRWRLSRSLSEMLSSSFARSCIVLYSSSVSGVA
jgi:hypothetical protein